MFIVVIGVTVLLGMWHRSFTRNLQKLENERKYIEMAHQMAGSSLVAGCNWAWFVIVIFLSLQTSWWVFFVYMAVASYIAYGTLNTMESDVKVEVGHDNDIAVESPGYRRSDQIER
jgi:hypothetical protein